MGARARMSFLLVLQLNLRRRIDCIVFEALAYILRMYQPVLAMSQHFCLLCTLGGQYFQMP